MARERDQDETKFYPTAGSGMGKLTAENYTHPAADVRAGLLYSFKALKTEKTDM
jgi:hypothetical protein